MDASFVIPVKGRLKHLKETIVSKLEQETEFNFEVLVVDYNCPDKTDNWCRKHKHPKLRSITVPAPIDYFNNSHCRNVGALYADGDILCFSDADCFLDPDWLGYVLDTMKQDLSIVGAGNDFMEDDDQLGRGTWAVRKTVWRRLRGYDETMEGWGGEELDFFWRMKRAGNILAFPREYAWTIKHGDEERIKYYDCKNKHTTNMINLRSLGMRGTVNPNGFGDKYKNTKSFRDNYLTSH